MTSAHAVRVLLLFVTFPAVIGADEARPPDECGNPRLISQSYSAAFGRVLEVQSGDRFTAKMHPSGGFKGPLTGVQAFRLVGIEAPPSEQELGRQSRARLSGRLLGKEVDLSLSPFQTPGTPYNVLVEVDGGDPLDENAGQLAAGMARAVQQGPYDLDWWLRCKFESAEAQAKAARLGVWAASPQ